MGKHSLTLNTDAQNFTLENLERTALEMCSTAPKPGSRRARREAERVAAKAAAENPQHPQSEKTIPVPASAPESVTAAPSAAEPALSAAANKTFAEYMNEHLVVSQVSEMEIYPKPRLFRHARSAVVALVAVTSIFSVGAGAFSLGNTAIQGLAYADNSEVNAAKADAQAIEKIAYTVNVDGKTKKLQSLSGVTIAQALENAEIKLGGQDEISVPLNAKLTDGAEITISRITFSTAAEEFVDSFQNKDEEDSSLPKGEKKISTAGVDGKGTRTFTVKYRDGKEISRQIVAEAITTARVDQITKIGTKENTKNSGSIAAPPAGPAPSPGSARAIAQEMLASRGWGAEQFSCLDALWQRESGWNAHAMNRSSGAYGIPQSLPGSKMAAAGADWQTNPATQIRWGLGYIQGRYGNPCGAWAHSQSVGWY